MPTFKQDKSIYITNACRISHESFLILSLRIHNNLYCSVPEVVSPILMCFTFIQSDSDWFQPEGANFQILSSQSRAHQPGVTCVFLQRLQLVSPIQQH